jgi:glutamate synthase (NADPH/NADH) small chain
VHNQIPDWNDLVYQGDWDNAIRNLHSTNNFPEFTGRICPAPCEEACTLNLEDVPVAIKTVEQAIADKAIRSGWVKPQLAKEKTGKKVAVVGGGDTASDCVGTAFRQGAVRVTQLDIRPQPPEKEDKLSVWPYWATKMRTSSSQAEGAEREFQVATLEFIGEEGQLTGVKCCEVDEARKPVAGSEFVIRADLAFIAIGFAGPFSKGVVSELDGQMTVAADKRRSNNVAADDLDYRTSVDRLYAAGDVRRGQSLVVWAIREGRQAARAIDEALMGTTVLPR